MGENEGIGAEGRMEKKMKRNRERGWRKEEIKGGKKREGLRDDLSVT